MNLLRPLITILFLVVVLGVLPLVLGNWWVLALVLLGAASIYCLSVEPLQELYGGSYLTALRHHSAMTIGGLLGFQIIRDGQTRLPRAGGEVFGPRLMIVGPGSAVVMESGGRQTGIRGPGIFQSARWEYVHRAFDLRSRQETIHATRVLTRDLIPTTVSMVVSYRLNVRPEVLTGQERLNADEAARIQFIDLNVPDWERAVRSTVQNAARQVVSLLKLQPLVTAGDFAAIEQQVAAGANAWLDPYGIVVDRVVIENIQPQQEVVSAAADRLIARVAQQAVDDRNAAIWTKWQQATVATYKAAQAQGVAPESIQTDALYRILRELIRNVSIQVTTPAVNREPFGQLPRHRPT